MSDLNLSPPKPSSSAPAFLVAAVLLLTVAGVVVWRYLHHVTHATIPHAAVFPVHTDFASAGIITRHESEDDIYVLITLHLQNDNTVPVFLKSYNAAFLDENGAQLTSPGMSAQDIRTVLATFPKIKPLATKPLDLETAIAPGASAEGMVLLQLPITQADWAKGKSAALTIGLYHQPSVTVPIPLK